MTCPHCHGDTEIGRHGASVCKLERVALPEGMKRCSQCKALKPATTDHFPRVRTSALSSWCRTCCSAAARTNRIARGVGPSLDPLKKLAFVFGCAKKGSEQEAKARAELVAGVLGRERGAA